MYPVCDQVHWLCSCVPHPQALKSTDLSHTMLTSAESPPGGFTVVIKPIALVVGPRRLVKLSGCVEDYVDYICALVAGDA